MHSYLALLPAVVSLVSAFTYPDNVPLSRRQEPGSPEYECHAACGNLLPLARTDGYCDNPDFSSGLDACLGCALETAVWQYYSDGVTAAAEQCGLDATPVPAIEGSDDASSSSDAPLEVMPSITDAGSAPMETMPSMTDAPTDTTGTGAAEATTTEEGAPSSSNEAPAAETSPSTGAASAQDTSATLFSVSFGAILVAFGLM